MEGTCKHGNPLTNSCSFCRVEGKEHMSGRAIPGVGQPLPTLRCRKCGYSPCIRMLSAGTHALAQCS